jgi:hypothetical protein
MKLTLALLLAAYLNLFKSRKRQLQGREDGAAFAARCGK